MSMGFGVGDRLSLLLPNGPDYIELTYACRIVGRYREDYDRGLFGSAQAQGESSFRNFGNAITPHGPRRY